MTALRNIPVHFVGCVGMHCGLQSPIALVKCACRTTILNFQLAGVLWCSLPELSYMCMRVLLQGSRALGADVWGALQVHKGFLRAFTSVTDSTNATYNIAAIWEKMTGVAPASVTSCAHLDSGMHNIGKGSVRGPFCDAAY